MLTKEQADGTHAPVTATDQMSDSFYTCPISIGTPAQVVDVNFDSGSADLWVWSTKLDHQTQEAGEGSGIKIFDPKKSETFKNAIGYTWKIAYGEGSGASGTVGNDTVKIGDITIQNQHIELAQEVSSQFQTESSSGLLGLAWGEYDHDYPQNELTLLGNINTVVPNPVPTPVDNMITQKDIPADAELWSVYLGSVKDQKDPDHGKSFYTFGNYDESVVKASGQEIAWTPIDDSEGFWMFPSESATINGKLLQLSGNRAMADTGTTLMLVSDEFCKALYAAIPGAKYDREQGGWLVPSEDVAIGNNQVTIEKEQLAWAKFDDNSNMSFGSIQSRGNNTFDIFGDTFLICCYAVSFTCPHILENVHLLMLVDLRCW